MVFLAKNSTMADFRFLRTHFFLVHPVDISFLHTTHYLAASCWPIASLYNICPVTSLHQKVQSGSLIEHRLLSVCLHRAGDTNDTGTNAASQEARPCPFIKSTRYLIISRDSEFCSFLIILHLNLMSICSSAVCWLLLTRRCVDSVVVFVSNYLLSTI